VPRPGRLIWTVAALRHQALQSHPAGRSEPNGLSGRRASSRSRLGLRIDSGLPTFWLLHHGQPLSDSETAAGESFPDPENAPVNSPAPANGIGQNGKARLACDHHKDAADQPAQGRTDFGSLDWCAQDFAADRQERRTD
jgi:hypothetical protein